MPALRHRQLISELRRAIIETPGATPQDQRTAAAASDPTGTIADAYLAKVRAQSYRITDDDIAALRQAGLTEDAIFELTLAAAFGEAERRFDAGVAAMSRTAGERG